MAQAVPDSVPSAEWWLCTIDAVIMINRARDADNKAHQRAMLRTAIDSLKIAIDLLPEDGK